MTQRASPQWFLAGVGFVAAIFSAAMWLFTWQYFCAIPLIIGLVCFFVAFIPLTGKRRLWSERLGYIGLLLAFVIAMGLIQYEIRTGYPVKIVVPDNYKGEFWIVVDKAKGQTPQLVNGVWIFQIPTSGILTVNDDSALTIGHEEDYVFASGQPFQVTDDGYGSEHPNEPVGYHWTVVPDQATPS